MSNILQQKIALSMFPHLGPRRIRSLVAYAGSVGAVFEKDADWLQNVPRLGKSIPFNPGEAMRKAEQELEKIQDTDIRVSFYLDDDYPLRLKECEDAPVVIYYRGNVDWNARYTLSIVGTRNASEFGKQITEEIVGWLAGRYPELLIVSGLAYGIDVIAHRTAIRHNLPTVAALGHGLDHLYPVVHRTEAGKILKNGALVSEFPSGKPAEPGNFISRNRIIAGLTDATLIVESAEKGGALITADLANSYNREVFAVPGRPIDHFSRGCNALISKNRAALVQSGEDIEFAMGWSPAVSSAEPRPLQKSLFPQLSREESAILELLESRESVLMDDICYKLELPVHKVSGLLLNLEFSGLVRALPGKQFSRI